MSVVIETTLGDFTVDLFTVERPHTCKNFLKLCKIKYYNFCLFHSVQHNFIAQTGDPTGTGKNGESIFGIIHGEEKKFFEAEVIPKIKHSRMGLLSMVNCGNNMLGSQFFLTLSSELQSLDGEHCVFGEITEGYEILHKLNEAICDTEHRPYQDIRITHTVILEDPFDDPPGLVVPEASPEPSKETLINSRIGPDEEIDDNKGLTAAELEEVIRNREAQAQATILEIVGDLPSADMAPPENVLFVCKLNPVTSDDDLEIIFSRFGKVKSCEVIRDKITGDSLQYAFVEFEEQKACEDAFFKMDNVLIDDRRIHVDFSQSVSKLRWKGKGRGVEHLDDNSLNRGTAPRKPGSSNRKHGVDAREERPKSDVRNARDEHSGRHMSSSKGKRERSHERPVRDNQQRKERQSPEIHKHGSSQRNIDKCSSHKYGDLRHEERRKWPDRRQHNDQDRKEHRSLHSLSKAEIREHSEKQYISGYDRSHGERKKDVKSSYKESSNSSKDMKDRNAATRVYSERDLEAKRSRKGHAEHESAHGEKDKHKRRMDYKESNNRRRDEKDGDDNQSKKYNSQRVIERGLSKQVSKDSSKKLRAPSTSSESSSSVSKSSSSDEVRKERKKTKRYENELKSVKKALHKEKRTYKRKKSNKKVSSSGNDSNSSSEDERKVVNKSKKALCA